MTSVYLDASALVPIFVDEFNSERVEAFLTAQSATLLVSDFASAEFVSALGRRCRMGDMRRSQVTEICASFDNWRRASVERIETTTRDIVAAERFLRRFDIALRTPDALNIALAQRTGAELATFDKRMAKNAEQLGVETTLL